MVITFLGSLVQSCCGEGGMLQTNHWHVLAVSQPHWVCPHSQRVCFPCLHCLGSRLLCQELSEAGPGLYALPRSKPLKIKYSGSPQRRNPQRLGLHLCPSQVRAAAQVTRCLASTVAVTYHLPRPRCLVFWVYNWRTFSADVDHPESQEVLVSNKACLQFGR